MTTIDELIHDQETRFLARTPASQAMWRDACALMPGGVTSSWASTRPIPVWIDRGAGSHVWDVDGNEYVDYHAGYGVNVVGHGNPHVVDAVQRRVTMGTHFAQPTPDSIDVARMLGERFGLPQWRFTNSGTEAIEGSLKLVRKYHTANNNPERVDIIGFQGSFHGRSYAAINASGNPNYLDGFGPRLPGYIQAPFGDLEALKQLVGPTTAGVIIEPVQGEGGVRAASDEFLRGLRKLADEAMYAAKTAGGNRYLFYQGLRW